MDERGYSIFISHAAVDEEIARSMKDYIERALPSHRIFVSSDPEDLALGDDWVSVILRALDTAEFVLVLATERGMRRKWVWFEAGRTWFSKVKMLPCCVGSLQKGNLPAPFSGLMAANIDDARDVKALFKSLRDHFGNLTEAPDHEEFARTMSRLDVRAEERVKVVDDPFASERIRDINETMGKLEPAQRETIRQIFIYGELTTSAVRSKVRGTGVNMEKWTVPEDLVVRTGWIVSKAGNKPYDSMEQNCYSINPTIKPYLQAYFLQNSDPTRR